MGLLQEPQGQKAAGPPNERGTTRNEGVNHGDKRDQHG